MKKTAFVVFVFALLLSLPVSAQSAKIAYVNPMKLMGDYEKAKDYEAQLESSKAEKLKEGKLQEKANEIKEMQKKIELLKKDEQEKQRAKIIKSVEEYRTIERGIFEALKKENEKKAKEVFDDIEKAIKVQAKKGGYDVVLDGAAVLYIKDSKADISELVVKDLNAKYKKTKK